MSPGRALLQILFLALAGCEGDLTSLPIAKDGSSSDASHQDEKPPASTEDAAEVGDPREAETADRIEEAADGDAIGADSDGAKGTDAPSETMDAAPDAACETTSCSRSCTDGIRNGTETDVDCGGNPCDGTGCSPCTGEPYCCVASDCATLMCVNRRCVPRVGPDARAPRRVLEPTALALVVGHFSFGTESSPPLAAFECRTEQN